MNKLTIFGQELIDPKCIEQITRCIGDDDIGVLTADAHYGYGHPIGGAVAYRKHISLSGVGFDIACGNKAVRTNISISEVPQGWVSHVMDEIVRRISFGMGRANNEPIDHPVLDTIRHADFAPQRQMAQLASNQLGTVGGGNHFVDVFFDEEGFVWIGVHFGSRGFGHKTTTGFIAMSKGFKWGEKASEGGMDAPPILFDAGSEIGQSYISAMNLAGEYAYAGRDVVVDKVLQIMGNPDVTFTVHNHHNFAWHEVHFGEEYWVVRKGCTPAFPDQYGFIGSNMYDDSVIIQGLDTPDNEIALYSTVHGAGRVMSRTEAVGKKKWIADETGKKVPTIISKGKVDMGDVRNRMTRANIELRGAGADEAPECYKKLSDVLQAHNNCVKIVHRLRPIGVAMAGADELDPYKD
jgi:tRNA-splicing ligase RtcB (3'-phosphate/5'-hydroxy nucleic acid ligase)